MAAPEGYTPLAIVGYTDKGTYNAGTTYNKYNVVLHDGSSYVAIKDGVTGVTPSNDGVNWRTFANGFPSNVVTTDNFQSTLGNYLANNDTTTNSGFALDARYGKTLQDSVDALNRKEVQLTNYYGDSGLVQTLTNEGIKFLEKDIVIPAKCKYIVWAHVTLETSNDNSIVFYMWENAYIQNQNIRWDYSKRTQYTFEAFAIGENITDKQFSLSLKLSDVADSAKTYGADNSSFNRIVAMIFPIA